MKTTEKTTDAPKGTPSQEKQTWHSPEIHRIGITSETAGNPSNGGDGGGASFNAS